MGRLLELAMGITRGDQIQLLSNSPRFLLSKDKEALRKYGVDVESLLSILDPPCYVLRH